MPVSGGRAGWRRARGTEFAPPTRCTSGVREKYDLAPPYPSLHYEPLGLAGQRKDRHLSSCAIRIGESGRAVESSRSSLAMPHPKPVGRQAQNSSETHCSHAERTPPSRKCRQLLSRRP